MIAAVTTDSGLGRRRDTFEVSERSPVGRLFRDPTVQSITIIRTPDGALLKGDRVTTYERITR